jgi:hypothetical protein
LQHPLTITDARCRLQHQLRVIAIQPQTAQVLLDLPVCQIIDSPLNSALRVAKRFSGLARQFEEKPDSHFRQSEGLLEVVQSIQHCSPILFALDAAIRRSACRALTFLLPRCFSACAALSVRLANPFHEIHTPLRSCSQV